jgi:hypothetical protein
LDGIHPTWVLDLLFYDRAGIGVLFRTDAQGGIVEVRTYSEWRSSWKQIIPVWLHAPASSGVPGFPTHGLLFYDDDGTSEFYTYDGKGEITLLRTHAWTSGLRIYLVI